MGEAERRDLSVAGHPTPVWVHPGRRPGRPVLMIHGFRGDHHGLDRIAHALRDRTAIVPDLPGFGEAAPLTGGLSLAAYLDHLRLLIAEVTAQWEAVPILVGHSFGSILVSHLAADDPAAMPELVLINPITTPALEGSARVLTALTRVYYELGARLPERLGRALLSSPVIVRLMSEVMATTKDPGLRRYIHDQHARYFSTFSDRRSLAQAFDVSVAHTVTEVAPDLTMPLLVIAGDRDAIAPIDVTRSVVRGLDDVRFVELSGVGHLVHYERPEAAASAIEEFSRTRD